MREIEIPRQESLDFVERRFTANDVMQFLKTAGISLIRMERPSPAENNSHYYIGTALANNTATRGIEAVIIRLSQDDWETLQNYVKKMRKSQKIAKQP